MQPSYEKLISYDATAYNVTKKEKRKRNQLRAGKCNIKLQRDVNKKKKRNEKIFFKGGWLLDIFSLIYDNTGLWGCRR